jgi:uncharacterized protein
MTAQSWTSPKTRRNQPSLIAGVGFFAVEPIAKGEVIAIKAGHIIDKITLEENAAIVKDSELQLTDNLHLAPLTNEEFSQSMISFNHSCEPNAGMAGSVIVVAMRDIASGEEINTDYAMHFTDPDYSIQCNCQKQSCRKKITGNDWKLSNLQTKYANYFSWHVQQKINQA